MDYSVNYSVLARKWRPKSLQEMVGQEHILTIIAHSIQQNRLHHAYLFCGTRGVGKTTLARIFTKCLNCETGPTATPCNQCNTCLQIDKGNYPDLIEIDAASRTKVEDTRELLDNVQYAPSSGKYKVYLIDEVHMLSGHSFNALLKTLEEPPEHVKFLLATTDPQKLPITVLSRCLKLSLKMLTASQISHHLAYVLTQEKIAFEPAALLEIAQAAQGSMRDGLSLLDQAIAFCDDGITLEKVTTLLGTETKYLNLELLEYVIDKQEDKVFPLIHIMEEKGADFLRATDDLLDLLHHIALYQKNSNLLSPDDPRLIAAIPTLSKKLTANDVQLLYQISLSGKRDLSFAPTLKIGFEMLILRAMDFYPLNFAESDAEASPRRAGVPRGETSASPQAIKKITPESWSTVINHLNLKGITLTIANQATVNGKMINNRLDLALPERHRALCNEKQQQLLSESLTQYSGETVVVHFHFTDQTAPEMEIQPESTVKQEVDVDLGQDPNLKQLLEMFDADIHETTMKKGK
jgi:DNA polymerase-3 subunit gamma/tau